MSYSFSVNGTTKAEIVEQAKAKMAEIVAAQQNHKTDQAAVVAAIEAFVGMLAEPEGGKSISMQVSGSLGWRGTSDEPSYTAASVNLNVYMG